MKRRIGAILLTICMLVGLLPTAALAAETSEETSGYKVTLNYDADQCSVVVTDKTTNTEVVNEGYVTIGTYGASMDIWVYVNDGYRIENVEFVDSTGTQDLTEHYIVGAYGWDPTLYAYSDCTLTVTTEAIPSDLPTATGIELYSDAARTEPMSSNVVLADGEYDVVYAKATYADGKEYPNYTARGTLEYTVDGETWKEGVYGDGQIDFQLNSYADEYYDTGVKYPQYDYRIRFDPDNMYCAGNTVYSEVYHVNGGVDGTAGGSGDSSSGDTDSDGESGLHKLAAPTDLNWHRFYDYNTNDGSYADFKGLISWQIADTEYDQTSRVVVYQDGEEVFRNGWGYRASRGEVYQSDWDFSLSDYGSGTYQFTVQACGDGETTEDSVVATSDPWTFTAASTKLATPETAWSSDEPLTATWESSTEDLAGGYQIIMYYSPDNANATSTANLDVVSRFVYYTALDGEQTSFSYDPEGEAGYYYFQVRAISSDESQVRHSAWSGLSTSYAYGMSSDGDGDTGSGGSDDTTNAVPVISDVNWSNGYLRIDCDYAEDADTSLVDSLTVDISTNGTDWVSFGDDWSSETKSIDVAYSAIRYNVPAGAYKKIRFTSEAVSGYSDAYAVFDMDLTITRSEVGTLSAAFAAEETENYYTVTVDLGDQSAKLDENGLCNGVIYTYSEDRYQDYGMDTGTVYFSYYHLDENGTTVTLENEFLRNPYWYIMYLLEETISADDQSLTTPKTVALTDLAGWKECFPACDHDWDDGEITTDPTCSAEGVKTFTCLLCGGTKTESVPATGKHSWGSWNTTLEATCTAAGSETHACGTCGATETQSTPKLNHNYEDTVTAPTCTEQGYTTHTCSLCSDSYKDSYVDALQHNWDEGVITTEPTESADGVKTYTCQRIGCGATKTEPVSKLAKQEVSWFPAGPITWTYGQVISAQNTAYNDTEDGGALTYSSSDESVATVDANGKATIVGAGTCEIIATAARVPGKYAETSASYTLIINKAPLTVTANNASITYGQVPANAGWTADGLVGNESVYEEVTGTAVYTYGYEQFGNVGSYAINVSGLTAANYEITYAPGTLTVNKATDYTITLGNLSQRDDAATAVTAVISPQDATAQIEVEYQVNGTWTSAVPTEAGEYPVRAALTSSDNIAVTGTYTNGTLVIERSIVVDNTDVSVTVDGEKAEIVVTDEELTEIVDNVDGGVSIDLSGVTDVTELTLPGNLMDALSQSDKADGLTVTTGDSSISMSGAVLDTVAKEVTGEDTVTVKLTSVEEDELNADQQAALDSLSQEAVIVEVSLVITHADGSTTELHELGGNVEITVPFEGEVPAGKYIAVCYLSDDGNVTYLRATYDAEKKQVTFKTNHFSNYAAFVSGSPMVVVNGGSGSGLYAEGSTVTIKADSKSGYTFSGWEIVAGTVALTDVKKAETTFVMPGEVVELTATYRKTSSGGGNGNSATYSINIKDAKHGEVTADPKTASKGDTVTLTVEADKGYALETLTVTNGSGKEVKLTKKDGKYTFKMPSSKVTVEATFMDDNTMLNYFVDVPADAYYYDAVLWAAEEGITGGIDATHFAPNVTCTRAQAVTFLWRAAGSPEPKSSVMPFEDVAADAYYYDAVLWAVENGITAGTTATTFAPNATCTRAQIVTFLWRSQKSPAAESVSPFTDVAAEAYYNDAVVWAVEEGVTAGTTEVTFSPDNDCTRAQIVTFLYRCMEK